MTRFNSVVPVLKVKDLQETLDFYANRFGFALCWRAGNDGGGENAMLKLGDIRFLFSILRGGLWSRAGGGGG